MNTDKPINKITVNEDIDLSKLIENFISFNLEKIKDNGEDSDPLIIQKNNKIGLFVFDGLGGAGSKKITIEDVTKTSAFLASRKVNDLTNLYFDDIFVKNHIINKKLIDNFQEFLYDELNKYKDSLNIDESKIKSSLLKTLPTTISGLIISKDKDSNNKLNINSIWAGDSRNYILTSQNGLKQLTTDDLREVGDAFENLSNDSKMSNCISADTKFKINHTHHILIDTPVIVFSSTDGAYDYLPTPMHFEYILLDSISKANNFNDLKEKIILSLKDIVGDDVSMVFVHIGWSDFKSLKKDFEKRLSLVKTAFIDPINELNNSLEQKNKELENIKNSISEQKQQVSNLKNNLWTKYSIEYNHLLNSSNTEL